MRSEIPDWKAWLKGGEVQPPDWIEQLRRDIWTRLHATKADWQGGMKKKPWSSGKPVATYNLGPFEFPLDSFASSRWHPRRTRLPVCLTRSDWRIAWQYWRSAQSYKSIRENIEKHGMRRPIIAEWFTNGDPERPLAHGCFATVKKTPTWPFLVARTGNERLLMAMFEWEWETIPTVLMVRDFGHDPAVSCLLRWVAEQCPWRSGMGIVRRVEDPHFTDDQVKAEPTVRARRRKRRRKSE